LGTKEPVNWRHRFSFVLGLVAILAFLGFFAFQLKISHDREQEFAFRENNNLAKVLEQHVVETFDKIDLALSVTTHQLGPIIAAGNPDHTDINRALADILIQLPEAQSLRVVDAEGNFIYDATGSLSPTNIADRPYFRRNRDDSEAGLVISEPFFARITQNWVITASRRLNDADGRFLGLIQAGVRTDYFQDFYETLNVGVSGTISLYDKELHLAARHPARPELLGKSMEQSPLKERLQTPAFSGDYVATSPLDGIERSYTFRQLANSPFFILIGQSQDEIFAQWRHKAWLFLAVAVALVSAFVVVVFVWRRSYRRAEALAETMTAAWQATTQRTRALLDSLPDPAWLKDKEGRMVAVNGAYRELIQRPDEALIGKTVFEIWPEAAARKFQEQDAAVLAQLVQMRSEGTLTRADGTTRYFEYVRTPAHSPDGEIIGIAGIARDLTERKEAEDRIRHMAEHDPLTDLPNRLVLSHRLTTTLADSVGHQAHIALLFLDLDHFKNINDSLGHAIGDKVLLQVAERLRGCLHEHDTVSRQGGDEFAILLVGCNSPAMIALIAQRLIDAIAQPFPVEGQELNLSASIGIAVYPEDGSDIGQLLKSADTAMYHVKASGRGNYQFFAPEMNTRVFERLSMENNLRRALKQGEFELHYQPQVDAADGLMAGVEALIRWHHPELGMVSPSRFIPVAEDTNLILPIGRWVLEEACRQNRLWQDQGLPPVVVSVNLSAVQFRQQSLVAEVAAILEKTGLDPAYLELELTESTLMSDGQRVDEVLRDLKALGISIAIDDFGTGYSSLSYLKRFPIDKIKIDQSFVRDVDTDSDNAAITQAIIGIARSLNMGVIAEGVETPSELEYLTRHHCRIVQGFYFSRPVDSATLAALLLAPISPA